MKVGKEKILLMDIGVKEIPKTWMYDILSDQSIYGLEIVCNNRYSMTFFRRANSYEEARLQSLKLLSSLEFKFPGLSGTTEEILIEDIEFANDFPFCEVKIPNIIGKTQNLFPILEKILHIFKKLNNQTIKFYIFWQRDDSIYTHLVNNSPDMSVYDTYKVKMFVMGDFNGISLRERENFLRDFKNFVEIFSSDLVNRFRERGEIIEWSSIMLKKINLFEVFWENKEFEKTGVRYRYMLDELSGYEIPSFINPNHVDFTFLETLPIPKSRGLSRENVNFLSSSINQSDIVIGKYVSNGVSTNKDAAIPLQSFSQSAIIVGQPGTGKTSLLGYLSQELYFKARKIGILYLNLGKGHQEHYYFTDRTIKYKDPEFNIPYYVEGDSRYKEKYLLETATYLITSLGLKDPVDKVLYSVMFAYIEQSGHLPESLVMLFRSLLGWYEKYQYHKEFQMNIIRAMENRIHCLFADKEELNKSEDKGTGKKIDKEENSYVNNILRLQNNLEPPDWFKQWRAGKKIFIDLSMCNMNVKRLLSMAIFQMVRTLIPDMEAESLQNLIVIDEAHQILEKPIINNPLDDDCIAREEIEKIFNILIREFRGKGLAFILADQTPHLLFNCVSSLPSLKILFRLGYQSSQLFTNDKQELDLITFQKNRQALILNGISAERYVIKTFDYTPFVPINHKNYRITKKECI